MKRFVFFCAQSISHLRMLLPLVEELVLDGHEVHVFTEAALREEVERSGARFHDLYEEGAVATVDATSVPIPCRYVAHAGVHGEAITERVRALQPDVVVYELFAVIGVVVAHALGLPAVNVLTAHAPVPERVLADIRSTRRIEISPECEVAVARLRDVHGLVDAHPLMYNDRLSPTLNLYPEPVELLPAGDRAAFEPLDYLGCLTPRLRDDVGMSPFASDARRRVLIAFGAISWSYFAVEAAAALRTMTKLCAEAGDDVVVDMAGASRVDGLEEELLGLGARPLPHGDQWAALADADVFVTHHGLNSTHEAIYHRTPMLSYPFFGDQPAAAARCAELGLAVPLVDEWRAPVTEDRAARAFAEADARRDEIAAALDEARSWELRTIADRPRIVDRVVALAR